MVLNDCFDLVVDRRERPHRPLPSGRVPVTAAWLLGLGFLAMGVLLALLADGALLWPTLLLAAAVLLYDGLLKHRRLGPLAMGLCRYLNWLLGLAAAPIGVGGILLALPVLLYTAGVTRLSAVEVGGAERGPVAEAGGLALLAGLAVVGLHLVGVQTHPLSLVALTALAVVIGARLYRVGRDPRPQAVQNGVRLMLLGMTPLDAVLLLGDGQWVAAALLLLLLLPGRLLARWIYVT
jgi:4-hydroxybenzoate polyprenyltransferase